uniref:Uncharacterized protein n=1 Tax=viral metagenome TaxID=1070528 RepID=A0A6C0KVP8_9ZZZZ
MERHGRQESDPRAASKKPAQYCFYHALHNLDLHSFHRMKQNDDQVLQGFLQDDLVYMSL